jgi:3-methylcrotonyl-CoA carboxylase alpha subunit
MFTKILIANRGEIACRVAASCARLAIKTVAVYSDADASSKHVAACDEAVYIGASPPQDSYLRWEKIIAAAKATGAQAIHPGYGFLSENEDFAHACVHAGLVFIGPPASAIKAMGLKAESKQLMEKAGVRLVPGYHGADQDPALLQREADAMGYPVLIKASAGGGGKGMRVVESAVEFAAALESCKREATSSFGIDSVLIEKYLQRPRHIEIQVFGDTHGNYVYLFERDCSVQRRHQKVLEEAPAPGLSPEMRQQMGEAAVAAARAVNYVGAGTVEFIVEALEAMPEVQVLNAASEGFAAGPPQGETRPPWGAGSDTQCATVGATFYFMEMNTRLQVEHPVTEAITGLDLVEWQLRVASGEPLPLQQAQLRIHGHAIEARICAENPDNNFLPATGTLQVYALPDCTTFERSNNGVRVDSGVRQGDTISPFYDSMVAKLIVHGATRQEALARMDAALAQTHIVGLATNVQFLRHVVTSASFDSANLDTGLIPREAAALFHQEKVGLPMAAAALVAHTLSAEQALANRVDAKGWMDPWAQRDGWKSHGASVRAFPAEFQGAAATVLLTTSHVAGHAERQLQVRAGTNVTGMTNVTAPLRYAPLPNGALDIVLGDQRATAHVYRNGAVAYVFSAQGATQIIAIDALAHAGETQAQGGRLTAPMPGKVVSFAVKPGDGVKKGQTLAVMDAMKMEHTIAAPADGTVTELLFAPGDQVGEGAELLRLTLK